MTNCWLIFKLHVHSDSECMCDLLYYMYPPPKGSDPPAELHAAQLGVVGVTADVQLQYAVPVGTRGVLRAGTRQRHVQLDLPKHLHVCKLGAWLYMSCKLLKFTRFVTTLQPLQNMKDENQRCLHRNKVQRRA